MHGAIGVSKYRALKSVISKISDDQKDELKRIQKEIEGRLTKAEDRSRKALDGSVSISSAARSSTRIQELAPLDELDERDRLIAHTLGGSSNFIHVYANLSQGVMAGWKILSEISTSLEVDELLIPEDEADTSRERMHDLSAEYALNQQSCEAFSSACMQLVHLRYQITNMSGQITGVVEEYYQALTERHSSGGLKVWHAPVLTDFALSIYDNIAHHGEVSDTSHDTEISAYSLPLEGIVVE